jgi:hypothetical protein
VLEKRVVNEEVLVFAGTGIVIEVAAFAGTVKSENSKIAVTKVEIFLIEILMKMFFLIKSLLTITG